MEKTPVSVVVLAKNEEHNIKACLQSVSDWAGEVIVADDESSDRTAEIAQDYACRVLKEKMTNEGRHRNRVYSQANHEWVLSLDADERVSDELKSEIASVVKKRDCQAYAVPIKTYIGDYWVRHSGWYPASKIRLFQKDNFRYEEVEVHPRAFVDGKTGELKNDIIHYGYPDISHFLASLNSQTSLEAQKWIHTGVNMTTGRIVRRAVDRFFRAYLRKRGFKDGYIGFIIATFASLYQVVSYAKYIELKNRNNKHVQ